MRSKKIRIHTQKQYDNSAVKEAFWGTYMSGVRQLMSTGISPMRSVSLMNYLLEEALKPKTPTRVGNEGIIAKHIIMNYPVKVSEVEKIDSLDEFTQKISQYPIAKGINDEITNFVEKSDNAHVVYTNNSKLFIVRTNKRDTKIIKVKQIDFGNTPSPLKNLEDSVKTPGSFYTPQSREVSNLPYL